MSKVPLIYDIFSSVRTPTHAWHASLRTRVSPKPLGMRRELSGTGSRFARGTFNPETSERIGALQQPSSITRNLPLVGFRHVHMRQELWFNLPYPT